MPGAFRPRPDAGLLVVIGLFLLGYWAFEALEPAPPAAAPAPATGHLQEYPKSRVVMYSLTTCGYCRLLREELLKRRIVFEEYFIDTEPARWQELIDKLQRAGIRPGPVGTPTLEVNGVMLPNNPSMRTVLKHL
jgi:glutaredoxin